MKKRNYESFIDLKRYLINWFDGEFQLGSNVFIDLNRNLNRNLLSVLEKE